jgi:hypothetical protein
MSSMVYIFYRCINECRVCSFFERTSPLTLPSTTGMLRYSKIEVR